MYTEKSTLDLFVRDSDLIEHADEISTHLCYRFGGSGGDAEETFEMDWPCRLIVSSGC